MKILLVARWPVGGIKTYFRYIYGTDVFRNAEITLLAPADGLRDFIATQLPAERITLIPVAGDGKSIKVALKKALKENHFDVVHSHGFSTSFFVQQVMWLSKTPHLMTAHDVFLPNTFIGFAGFFKKIGMYWLLSTVTKVLSVSEDARNNIYEYFPSLSTAQVKNITNGIDTSFFSKGVARDFRGELNLAGRPIIGFFGRFMAQKGFRQIIQAIEILEKEKFIDVMPVVLTFGWGGFIREDYALIETMGLSTHFRQMPFTDDVAAAIKGGDMVVMPSRWEACGLLAMEVLSAGTPLISSNCIGLRCVVENTPAKTIQPYSPEQLADAIAAELKNSSAAEFAAFQPEAVERFNLTRPAVELHNYYKKIQGEAK